MALENNAGIVIYQGEDKEITIRLADQNGDPVSLSSASEIVALFKKDDGSALVKRMSTAGVILLNAGGGIFKAKITANDSLHLALGENQPIEIRITISQSVTYAQVQNAYSVFTSLFPGA